MSGSLWEQIVSDVRSRIVDGELRSGDRIRSQRELCDHYGVSRITVRKALSELASEGLVISRSGIGTFVLPSGSAISKGKTTIGTLGLVLRDLSSPFFVEVMRGVEQSAYTAGYTLLCSNTSGQTEKEETQIEHFKRAGVDGLIVASMRNEEHPPAPVTRMHDAGFPYVMVSYVGNRRFRCVGVDNVLGGSIAARHLVECGYESVGYLNSEKSNLLGKVRKKGFLDALDEIGRDPGDVFEIALEDRWDISRFEKGYAAGSSFLSSRHRPEAMFIYNDQAAYGFCKRIAEAGLRIPDDVAVIGFDGIERNGMFAGTLTTVRQPMEEIGMLAVDAVLKQIAGRAVATRIMVEPELAPGTTTAPRNGAESP